MKNRPTLGPSISGTKCDRDNPNYLQKEGVNRIVLRYKIGTQSDCKSQKWGSSLRTPPTMPKYGSTHPRASSRPGGLVVESPWRTLEDLQGVSAGWCSFVGLLVGDFSFLSRHVHALTTLHLVHMFIDLRVVYLYADVHICLCIKHIYLTYSISCRTHDIIHPLNIANIYNINLIPATLNIF